MNQQEKEDASDIVLSYLLNHDGIDMGYPQYNQTVRDLQMDRDKINRAITYLITLKLIEPRSTLVYYVFTDKGRDFANDGGFKGERERKSYEEREKTEKEKDREILRRVSDSTLETNESVILTNQSVQTTNDSVSSLNTLTKKNFKNQNTIAWSAVIVAIAAALISLFQYMKDDDNTQILPAMSEIKEQQRKIDSLQYLLNKKSAVDSPQIKPVVKIDSTLKPTGKKDSVH